MIRSEIKNFTIRNEKLGSYPCTVPCSLLSVLSERGGVGAPKNEAELLELEGYFDSPVDLETSFELTAFDLARRYIFLRFRGLDTSAQIYLNGRLIAKTHNSQATYTVDVKSNVREGKNDLKITLSPEGAESFCRPNYRGEAEYSYSFSDAGIFSPVELLKFNNAIVDKVHISQRTEGESVVLSMRLDTLGNAESTKAVATLVSSAGQVYYGGFSRGQGMIQVRQPLYWWPHGLGMQNLYRLTVNLYGERDIEDSVEMNIGIGTQSVDVIDSHLTALANGVDYLPFAMIYTHADIFPARLTDEKIARLISSAAASNVNTLIISGEVGFADERIFDACDRLGIAVWQQLPFGKDGTILNMADYKRGISDSLSRLAHHPSLALVIDTVGLDEGGELRSLCRNSAPHVSFMSADEYGRLPTLSYPAFPEMKTISQFAAEGANLLSEEVEWQIGDKLDKMLTDAAGEYLYAADLPDFAYLSRLLSARAAQRYVHSIRSDKERALPAIISRLADSHPTVSDAMLDYSSRPKALAYYQKRFFSPVLLIPVRDGFRVSFIISNERRQSFSGMINYRILDAENNLIYNGQDEVSAAEMSVTEVKGRDLSEVMRGHEREYYLEYSLRDGVNTVSRGTLLFVKPKRFAFRDPHIKTQISGSGRTMTLTISADSFAKDVEISFAGHDTDLRDNLIDITSQTPVKINFTVLSGSPSVFDLEESISTKCLYNIGNVNNSLKKARINTKIDNVLEKLKF